MNKGILITAFSVLSAIAIAGWARKPAAPFAVQAAPAYRAVSPDVTQQYVPAAQLIPVSTAPVYRAAPARTRTVVREPVRRTYQRREIRRARPLKNSVAIVAGSAGAGALIGGLAGGGKGAAIGALSGGAAGFIYDRITAKK